MADERLIHDVAVITSQHILKVFAGCFRAEDEREAFAEIYERIKFGIEVFEIKRMGIERPLNPGRN